MAKDYLGKEINIGDSVVYMKTNYREFKTGIIVDITPKQVKIMPLRGDVEKREHHNVVKIG